MNKRNLFFIVLILSVKQLFCAASHEPLPMQNDEFAQYLIRVNTRLTLATAQLVSDNIQLNRAFVQLKSEILAHTEEQVTLVSRMNLDIEQIRIMMRDLRQNVDANNTQITNMLKELATLHNVVATLKQK